MFLALQIVSLTSVAVSMALPLAHLLEWPGKLRLGREQYLAMQKVYYPGFTWAGFLEPVNLVLVTLLAVWTPPATAPFWLAAFAVIFLGSMHAAYWLVTHPMNRDWLAEAKLGAAGRQFFGTEKPGAADTPPSETDWRRLRYRWELSHALRAGLGLGALAMLAAAAAL